MVCMVKNIYSNKKNISKNLHAIKLKFISTKFQDGTCPLTTEHWHTVPQGGSNCTISHKGASVPGFILQAHSKAQHRQCISNGTSHMELVYIRFWRPPAILPCPALERNLR
ncbi:hypothetical protein CHARACLAT_001485 [Characodon lateralis]|uniref:Uncharacterized protein n=1 Tax=Characodon lateralis TaxID=208331 RepID=A0ABU7CTV8_9TELE|nr:hypothetical protein [Characodon lateralis]